MLRMCSGKELVCLLLLSVNLYGSVVDQLQRNKYIIQSRGIFTDALLQGLRKLDFSLLFQITPSVYIFEYEGYRNAGQALQLVENVFHDQIQATEPTRNYINTIKPVYTPSNETGNDFNMENLACDNYYEMSVQKVWDRNITGKGVTIAINDVGIDTDLPDLEPNINKKLCIDFFKNSSDVSPNHFTDLLAEPPPITNHGNNVAGVTAAVKNNNLCSAGIAFDATLVGIKMCTLELQNKTTFDYGTKADILSRALTYMNDVIDIYVNAWAPVKDFDQLDLATRNAIESGAVKVMVTERAIQGRHGLGAIHVVPTGPSGNSLSNNIHTITVNNIPRYGEGLADVNLDASVLVSGLRDGSNLTATSMVTTRNFKGLSAAVSQVSGIIALGLQANPDLSLRDVQHLLVQSSEHERLGGSIHFKTSGALRKFNNFIGFGLVNADKLVSLALKHKQVSGLVSLKLPAYSKRNSGLYTQIFDFCHSCSKDSSCITFIEHVTLDIRFTTSAEHLIIDLISPSGTPSSLMDRRSVEKKTLKTREGKFVSVHFWDEESFGIWQVKVQSKTSSNNTTVHNISLTLHGTDQDRKNKYQPRCERGITNKTPDDDSEPTSTDVSTKGKHFTETSESMVIIIVVVIVVVVITCAGLFFRSCYINILHVDNYYDLLTHIDLRNDTTTSAECKKLPVKRNETDI